MSEQSLRRYRERWQAVNAVEVAERRAAPMSLRWQQLNAIVRLAQGLGLPLKPDEEEAVVWQRWAQIKEQQR